jgi:hypothetical protein
MRVLIKLVVWQQCALVVLAWNLRMCSVHAQAVLCCFFAVGCVYMPQLK